MGLTDCDQFDWQRRVLDSTDTTFSLDNVSQQFRKPLSNKYVVMALETREFAHRF